ncbi:ER to Golgi transport-related protein [Clavulina sp. PMI_390]|nr:ER to Golgi transport-related protein [Clavulina sp. PMI_390]
MEQLAKVQEVVTHFRETRLTNLRPLTEFFNPGQISRPADMNQVTSRISYNTRYFAGNYGIVVAVLAVYALITNIWLLGAIAFLFGGFTAINRFAPEPTQVGDYVITQKGLYIGLFVIGIPMLYIAAPLSTFFWIIGASLFCIVFHASIMEPGVESEYSGVESV